MSRTFRIRVDAVEYVTRTYEVEANDFEDAREQYERGYADLYDEDTYDSCDNEIESIECYECDGEEGDCECSNVDEKFFATLGL